jgi:DNA-binding MarR family transcriptional regulator
MEVTQHVVVSIGRRVPRILAAWRRVEALPLTSRQKQLCLALARKPGRDDLAEIMGVGKSTAVSHLRSIYGKQR